MHKKFPYCFGSFFFFFFSPPFFFTHHFTRKKVYAIYADKKSIAVYFLGMVFFGVLTPFVFSAMLISVKFFLYIYQIGCRGLCIKS